MTERPAVAESPHDALAHLDATAQADLVRRGEVTASELVRAAIERIERHDFGLGAVAIPLFEQASRDAACFDRREAAPFAGAPFLLKDLGATEAGQPWYGGNAALRDAGHRSSATTPLAASFRRAGLIPLGKSKTPELGLQSTTQPLAFGPAHNPWDLRRSPGGSSGGACVAVAAGLVPIAHATDAAGSIRIPAAWCGLVGLKPSRLQESAGMQRGVVGFVVTRSVRDTARLLAAVLEPPSTVELETPLPKLRVGVIDAAPGLAVHPECAAAVQRAARLLESLGCEVHVGGPPELLDPERKRDGWVYGVFEFRMSLRWLEHLLARPVTEHDVEPFLWRLADPNGPEIPETLLRRLGDVQLAWRTRVLAWWDRFDLLLTPTVHEPPVLLDELDATKLSLESLVARQADHMAFTEPFSALGTPAISLPMHWTRDGLPVGVQLVAAPGRDELLVHVATHLEPHFAPRPRLVLPRAHAYDSVHPRSAM